MLESVLAALLDRVVNDLADSLLEGLPAGLLIGVAYLLVRPRARRWHPGAWAREPRRDQRGGGRGGVRRSGRRAAGARGHVEAATVALALDLIAAAVTSGLSPGAAIAEVGEALGGPAGRDLVRASRALALGVAPQHAWAGSAGHWEPVERCLTLAQTTGAPVAALLREAASARRRGAHQDALTAAARLSVRIVLPLGLCALPAFFLTGVAPVVLALAGSLLGA